jgi:hypothetical protein
VRAVVFVLVATATVHAQPAPSDRVRVSEALQKIAQLEQQLEYEQALVLADRTIAEGVATRDQLADLHLIAGRLAAGLDHPDIAQQHFAKVLALRPETTLVAGTSPKLLAPFDAAKAAPHELAIAMTDGHLVVTRDDLKLAQGTRTRDGVIEAFDEHGNQLAVEPIPVAKTNVESRTSRAWIPWAAASGATLIAGGLCAWRYGVAQDEWNRENDGMHDYTRLHALEDRGRRWAIAADVGFGLAAASAITAVILYATGERVQDAGGVAFTGNGAMFQARF